jgi:ribosome biogenesis GTPase A
MKELKAFRALISTTAKSFLSKLKQSSTQLEARVTLAEAQISLARLYNFPASKLDIASDVLACLDPSFSPDRPISGQPPASCLSELLSIHVALRRIPEIDLSVPTLVLVGAPNVGKSSLVRSFDSIESFSP